MLQMVEKAEPGSARVRAGGWWSVHVLPLILRASLGIPRCRREHNLEVRSADLEKRGWAHRGRDSARVEGRGCHLRRL